MKHDFFWAIVEAGWCESASFVELQAVLHKTLREHSRREVAEFQESLHFHRRELLRADHLCAAYLLEDGYLNEEVFYRYTELIVMSGEENFRRIALSADNIVDIRRLDGFSGIEVEAGGFVDLGMDLLEEHPEGNLYIQSCLKTIMEPIVIDAIYYEGLRGVDVVTQRNYMELVPRVYRIYGRYGGEPTKY